jgi:type I restriction enzyme, S subunit
MFQNQFQRDNTREKMANAMDDWEDYTIKDCCEILDHRRVPINAEQREKIVGNVPYYGANGIQGYIDKHLFDEDLILVAEDGGNFDQFATRPIAYKISGKSWVNNHAHILRAKPGFNQDLIFYSLVHKNIVTFIVGGTRSKLNQSELRSITLRLPNVKEVQDQIAAILSRGDKAIEQTEALIAKQQRIKAGLMHDLLTRGIDEHGDIRSEATHDFKDSPLGRIPAKWDVCILDNAIRIIDCKHITPKFAESGFPFVRPRNVKMEGLDLSDVDFVTEADYRWLTDKHEPHIGDIVFSRNASFGVPCYVATAERFAIGQDVVVMTESNANTRFVYFVLLSTLVERQIRQVSTGSTFGRINLAFIRKLEVPIPDKPEQEQIVAILDSQQSRVRVLKEQLEKLKKVKTGLMQDLLTGKVPVNALLETRPQTIQA